MSVLNPEDLDMLGWLVLVIDRDLGPDAVRDEDGFIC